MSERRTGSRVALVSRNDQPGPREERWIAACREHPWITYAPTRTMAESLARIPDAWCAECKAAAEPSP